MDKEYKQIRKGLIALMCVGDEIRYVHSGITIETVVSTQIIEQVTKHGFKIRGYNYVNFNFDELEVYNGRLHVWCDHLREYPCGSIRRAERLAGLIESAETLKYYE
jgi:hypothetical protein